MNKKETKEFLMIPTKDGGFCINIKKLSLFQKAKTKIKTKSKEYKHAIQFCDSFNYKSGIFYAFTSLEERDSAFEKIVNLLAYEIK